MKLNRPKYNGEWTDEHINWFVKRFAGEEKEISSEIVQNAHGRVKENRGEQKPKAQDFRNLMRLVVKKRLARVTQGFSEVSSYRIRLVFDDNYIQDEFLNCLLFYPSPPNLPPTKEEFSTTFSDLQVDWTPQHQEIWRKNHNWWCHVPKALSDHQYAGGDLEDLPDYFTKENKEHFVLMVNQIICQYRAIKLWWEVGARKEYYHGRNLPDGSIDYILWNCPDHLFIDMLRSRSICMFMNEMYPEKKFNRIYRADRISEIRALVKEMEKLEDLNKRESMTKLNIVDPVRLLTRNHSESKEAFHCNFATSKRLRDILEQSSNPAVKEACKRWVSADEAWMKWFELGLRRKTTK
jgi:hypothetical protein